MKPVLMENAFEAWAAAIRFCDDIKDGKATLQYQKDFVLSLHNAVELIMKQMLLNNNDHRVAEVRKAKNEADAKLLFDYFKATDLNSFFDTLSKDLIQQHMELSSQFDEIWSVVYMMQCLEMIAVDEILDDEQGRVYFVMSVLF